MASVSQWHARKRLYALTMLPATEPEEPELLGHRVRRLRLQKNWSQHQLAQKAGMHERSLIALEKEPTRGLQSRHVVGLAQALGVTCDALLGVLAKT